MESFNSSLRKRFLSFAEYKWSCANTYDINYKEVPNKSGVYFFATYNTENKTEDILYVGSSTNLNNRYKGHNLYRKLEKEGDNSPLIFYFIEMNRGFYDYERKLINRLKPKYNTQHKWGKND